MRRIAIGRLVHSSLFMLLGCGQVSDADRVTVEEPRAGESASLEAVPTLVFGPDSFPAFASFADAEQLALAVDGCRDMTPDGCRDYQFLPRVTATKIRATPSSSSVGLGTVLVISVPAKRDEWNGGSLSAYYLREGSDELEPLSVDLDGGWNEKFLHYAARRFTSEWVELAAGPWGESAWVRLMRLRGPGGIAFVTPGTWLDFDGTEWIVREAGMDHLVLEPAPDMDDWCINEDVPAPEELFRTLERAELTDASGHYLFKVGFPVC